MVVGEEQQGREAGRGGKKFMFNAISRLADNTLIA